MILFLAEFIMKKLYEFLLKYNNETGDYIPQSFPYRTECHYNKIHNAADYTSGCINLE